MITYTVTREVIETIEVEADDPAQAEQAADESPIALWTRDIKSYETAGGEDRIHRWERSDEDTVNGTIDLTERDQVDEVIGR